MSIVNVNSRAKSALYQKSYIFHCDNCGSYLELSGKEVREAREEKNLTCIECGSEIDTERYIYMFRRFYI